MKKKIIAVGNMVMCDEGIGIKIAEFLSDDFRKLGFQLIIGETDISYCINKIEDNDFIIVLSSSYYDIEPGTVTFTPLNKVCINQDYISQHGLDLLQLLHHYNKNVNGFFITIEASEIYFNPDLSPDLKSKFTSICKQCLNYINLNCYVNSNSN